MNTVAIVAVSAQRQLTTKCRLADTVNLAHRFQRVGEKPIRRSLVEPASRCLHLHRQQIRAVEPRMDREELLNAAQEQSSIHEQHQRERYFRNDERTAHHLAAARSPPRALLKLNLKLAARDV